MHSIQALLTEASAKLAAVSDSANLDAEVLLALTLNKPRSHLRAWPDKLLPTETAEQFAKLVSQRQQGIPVAYLTGRREFWSRNFEVNPDVLIPRPDTELLIELSLELIRQHPISNILDLGTGSGIIAITLAAECPQCQILAIDKSLAALAVARQNAANHQLQNIQFMHSDWFTGLADEKFELILSNPPYIADDDEHLRQGDVRFEPKSALVADRQGLGDIETIAGQARRHITENGHLLIEHGYQQQQQVQAIFNGLGYTNIITYPDLAGNPRASYGQWQNPVNITGLL